MKRLLIITLIAVFYTGYSHAVTLNTTKIGGVYVTNNSSVGELALTTATAFRSLTPLGIAVGVGKVILGLAVADQLNKLFISGGQSFNCYKPSSWSDCNTPPNALNLQAVVTDGASTPTYYPSSEYFCNLYSAHDIGIIQVISSTTSKGQCNSNSTNAFAAYYYVEQNQCPIGYTKVSGSCTLSNANLAVWPSDGVPTIKQSGTTFIPHPKDTGDNTGIPSSQTSYSRTGTDLYNNPVKETITPNSNGGLDYVRDTQSINSTTGEPLVQRDRFTTDSNGVVQTSSSVTYENSTINNVVTNQTTTPQIDTSTLAKESTLQDIDSKLTKDTTPLPDSGTVRSLTDSTNLVINKFKTHFPSLNFSDVSGNCPTFTQFIPLLNVSLTIDQFCTMAPYITPTLDMVMPFLWLILGLVIVLRA